MEGGNILLWGLNSPPSVAPSNLNRLSFVSMVIECVVDKNGVTWQAEGEGPIEHCSSKRHLVRNNCQGGKTPEAKH